MTWHFESVLNWIWPCCISTHLTFQVSQGSATTDLRWVENFNKFLFRNSLLYIAVKKLRRSVNIFLSYRKNKSVSFFYGPQRSSSSFQLPYGTAIQQQHTGFNLAQGWASECPDVKNCKRLNPVWHRMIYSCTHMATVGVKGLIMNKNASTCNDCQLSTGSPTNYVL